VTRGPRVLLAPDKFKGTLTGAEVGAALRTGLLSERPDAEIRIVPIADGGDGTLLAAEAAGFRRQRVTAAGPTGVLHDAAYARRGEQAVVELAEVAGLTLLSSPAPLSATTLGVGQVIRAALQAGCRSIVVGLGGSASTDGGAGLLVGLGARLLDASGAQVPPGAAALMQAVTLDLTGLPDELRDADLIVATDVDNTLTGPGGAAHCYAPQKGAAPEEVLVLERCLQHWADLVADTTGQDLRGAPGAGAAGGTGFALMAVLRATRRPGAEVVFDMVGLADHLAWADVAVTGEGSLDQQTLHGKGPGAVAELARTRGTPTYAVAGRVLLTPAEATSAGFTGSYGLIDLVGPHRAWHQPHESLVEVGRLIGRTLVQDVDHF
jgi:glycerate kinase